MVEVGRPAAGAPSKQEVAVAVDRLKSARDPNDRLNAIETLQALAKDAPGLVSQAAMPTVVDLLRARHLGQLDDSTAQNVLELLQSLVSSHAGGNHALAAFLNPPSNLDALLDLLEGTDTLTTVTTLQVVMKALEAGGEEMERVLVNQSQEGVVRLIGCLSDDREEVQNEVLLVLSKLTSSRNENVKTLVVFNDAFDKIFDMMQLDGGVTEGTVITLDCLRLLANLVEDSSSTQRQFVQLGSLQRLAPVLDLTRYRDYDDEDDYGHRQQQQGGGGIPALTYHQREGLRLTLGLLRLLASGGHSSDERQAVDRAKRQLQIFQTPPVFRWLVQSGMGPLDEETAARIQDQALLVLAQLLERNQDVQDRFLEARLDPSYLTWVSPLVSDADRRIGSAYIASVMFRLALRCPSPSARVSSLLLCHRLFEGNEMAALAAIQHVIAPPPPPLDLPDDAEWTPAIPPGQVLLEEMVAAIGAAVQAVAMPGPETQVEREAAQSACNLLEHLLVNGGLSARELATRIPMNIGRARDGKERKYLLDWVAYLLKECLDAGRALEGIQVAIFRLLVVWTCTCRTAARTLLKSTSNLFIIDLLAPSREVVVGGSGGGVVVPESLEGAIGSPSRGKPTPGGGGEGNEPFVHIRALAALLLGLCMEYWGVEADEESGWARKDILSIIENRVGLTSFTATLEKLDKILVPGRNFIRDWPPGDPESLDLTSLTWPYYDGRFVDFYRKEVSTIRKTLFSIYSGVGLRGGGGGSDNETATKYNQIIMEQEKEIDFLKQRIKQVYDVMQELQKEGKISPSALEGRLTPLESPRGGLAPPVGNPGVDTASQQHVVVRDEEMEQRLQQLEGEAKGLSMTVVTLEEELGKRDDMIRSLTAEMGQMRGSLAAAMAAGGGEVDDGEDSSAALMAENWTLKAELSRAQEDLAATQTSHKAEVNQLRQAIGSIQEELKKAKDEAGKQALMLQRQSQLASKLQEERDKDDVKRKALESETEHLNKDYQEAQQRLEKLQKTAHGDSQRLKQLEEEKDRLIKSLHDKDQAVASSQGQERLRQAEEESARLAHHVSQLQQELHRVNEAAQSELQRVLGEKDGLLKRQEAEARQSIEHLTRNLQNAEAEKEGLRRMVQELESRSRQGQSSQAERLHQIEAERESLQRAVQEAEVSAGQAWATLDERLKQSEYEKEELRRALQEMEGGNPAHVQAMQEERESLQRAVQEAEASAAQAWGALDENVKQSEYDKNELRQALLVMEEEAAQAQAVQADMVARFDAETERFNSDMAQMHADFQRLQQSEEETKMEAQRLVDEKEAEMAALRTRVEELQHHLQAGAAGQQAEIQGLHAKCADLERQLKESRDEMGASAARAQAVEADMIARFEAESERFRNEIVQVQSESQRLVHEADGKLHKSEEERRLQVEHLTQERTAETTALRSRVEELQQHLQTGAAGQQAEIQGLHAKCADLEQQLKESHDREVKAAEIRNLEVGDLKDTLYREQAALREAQEALEREKKATASLTEQLLSTGEEIQELKRETTKAQEVVGAAKAQAEEEVERLREALAQSGEEQSNLLSSASQREGLLSEQLKAAEEEAKSLKDELAQLKAVVATGHSDVQRVQAESTDRVNQLVEEKNGEIERLSREAAQARQVLDAELQQLRSSMATQRSRLADTEAELARVREEASRAPDEATATEMVEEMMREVAQLRQVVKESVEGERRRYTEHQEAMRCKEEQVSQLRQELEQLRSRGPQEGELEQKTNQCMALERQLHQQEAALESKEGQIADLQAKLLELAARQAAAEASARHEDEQEEEQEQEGAAAHAAAAHAAEVEELLAQKEQSEGRVLALEHRVRELEQAHQTLERQRDLISEEFKQIIAELRSRLAEAEEGLGEKRAETERLAGERKAILEQLQRLENNERALEAAVQAARDEAEQVRVSYEKQAQVREQHTQQVEQRLQALATRREDLNTLLEENERKDQRIRELEEMVRDSEGQILQISTDWKEMMTAKEQEVEALRSTLPSGGRGEEAAAAAGGDGGEGRTLAAELQSRVQELEGQLEQTSEQLASTRAQFEHAKEAHRDLEERYERLVHEQQEQNVPNDDTPREMEAMNEAYSNLQQRYDQLLEQQEQEQSRQSLRLEEAQTQLDAVNEGYRDLQERYESLVQEREQEEEAGRAAYADLQARYGELVHQHQEEHSSQVASYEEAQRELESFNEAYRDLQERYDQLVQEHQQASQGRAEDEGMLAEIGILEQKLQEKEDELETIRKDHAELQRRLLFPPEPPAPPVSPPLSPRSVKTLRQELESARATINFMEERLSSINDPTVDEVKMAELQLRIEELETNLADKQEECVSLRSAMEVLEGQPSEDLSRDVRNLEQALQDLQSTLVLKEEEVASLQEALSNVQSQPSNEEMEGEVSMLQTRVSELETMLRDKESERASLAADLADLQGQMAAEELYREVEDLRNQVAELEAMRNESGGHHHHHQQQQQSLAADREIQDLRSRVDELEVSLSQKEEECFGLHNTLAEAGAMEYMNQGGGGGHRGGESLERVVGGCLALLESRLAPWMGANAARVPSSLSPQRAKGSAGERLRSLVEQLIQKYEAEATSSAVKEGELAQAAKSIRELKSRVDTQLQSEERAVERVRQLQEEKDRLVKELQDELGELRAQLAASSTSANQQHDQRGEQQSSDGEGEQEQLLVEVGAIVTRPPPTTTNSVAGSMTAGQLMVDGLLLEVESLRTDYEALQKKYHAAQTESSSRIEHLSNLVEEKESTVAMLTRDLHRVRNEVDFELKLKAGLVQERDRSIESLNQRIIDLKRLQASQAEKLEGRVMMLEDEKETLRREVEGLELRLNKATKSKETAVADLRAELARKEEKEKETATHMAGRLREKEDLLNRYQSQIQSLRLERDRARRELDDDRIGREESVKALRKELDTALENAANLQLEVNSRELQLSAMRRELHQVEAEARKAGELQQAYRELEAQFVEKDRRFVQLEGELQKVQASRDTLRLKIEETWGMALEEESRREQQQSRQRAAAPRGGKHDAVAPPSISPPRKRQLTPAGTGGANSDASWYGGTAARAHEQQEVGGGGAGSLSSQRHQTTPVRPVAAHRHRSPPPSSPAPLPAVSGWASAAGRDGSTAASYRGTHQSRNHHQQPHLASSGGASSLEEDLHFLQSKLSQLKKDLGEERRIFSQLEIEHEDLLDVLARQEVHQHGLLELALV